MAWQERRQSTSEASAVDSAPRIARDAVITGPERIVAPIVASGTDAGDTVRLRLPELHPGQLSVVAEAKRFNVLACGRRWGKTTLGIDRLIEPALRGFPVAWMAPTYKSLLDAWRILSNLLAPVTRRAADAEHRIELVTDGVIEGWSLDNAETVRGRAYKRVVIDEAAQVSGLDTAWQNVIRPTLTDFEGDAWLLSTPAGLNFFWQLHRRASDPQQFPDWASWQRPTSENPHVPGEEIARAQRESPESVFRQEYQADFIEGTGGVLRKVTQAATAERQERAVRGHVYVVGCDWAKQQDFTVFCVIDATQRSCVHIDRMQRVDYQLQLGRLEALVQRFKPDVIVAEKNAIGEPIIEQLQMAGLPVRPFTTTSDSKKGLIERLALAFEQDELRIPADQVLLGELQAYRAERLPSGLLRYSAPEGQHDDTVMALALAWSAAVAYPKERTADPGERIRLLMRERDAGEPEDEDARPVTGYMPSQRNL